MTSSITPLWNQMTKNRFNLVFFVAFFFLALAGYSQEAKKSNSAKVPPVANTSSSKVEVLPKEDSKDGKISQSILEHFKGKKEDVAKRDFNAKHFLNNDGSTTALIGNGPVHYKKDGYFLDIDSRITNNNDVKYPYANTSNLFESYFGATAHVGVRNNTTEGEIVEFLNTKMYWEVFGQAVQSRPSSNSAVIVTNEKALYNNIYGSIDAEFIIESGRRKLNYLIPNREALGNIPTDAQYLVFTEDVLLPKGWSYKIDNENGITLYDTKGVAIYNYESPISTDSSDELSFEPNTKYETVLHGNTLTIRTKVQTTWLLGNRQFPVKVDPTVNATPNNTTNWSRSVYSNGSNSTSIYFGYQSTMFISGSVKFNISSIPSTNIDINSVVGYINITAGTGTDPATRQWQLTNSADPTTTSGTALFNSMNTGYSTITTVTGLGWRNSALYNPQGNSYVAAGLASGAVSMGIVASGNYTNGTYMTVANHTSGANRPYLAITYTASTACSGTPTAGTASVSPISGAPSSTYNVSATSVATGLGLTFQWQNNINSAGWNNVGSATSSYAALSGQIAPSGAGSTVLWRLITTCTNSGLSNTSNATTFTTIYCTAGATSTQYEKIANVNFANINNNSTSTAGYENFTSVTGNTNKGQTYPLTVSLSEGYAGDKLLAWIDYNQDGDFDDPGETVFESAILGANEPIIFIGNITIPGYASLGTTRMRIRLHDTTGAPANNTPCGNSQYGQVEDYTINIAPPLVYALFHNYGGSDQLAFNNSHIAISTPTFRISCEEAATDFQVEISSNTNFTGAVSQTFTGTYPINTQTNFTFTNGFTPSSGTTYYVRARVRGAANTWSNWTIGTYSFTYDTSTVIPNWFQTTQAQLETATHSGTIASTSNDIVINPAGSNPIQNPSFETATNWTKSGLSGTSYNTITAEWVTAGSNSMKIYSQGPANTSSITNNDNIIVYQQNVNLTGVSKLTFDLRYLYNDNFTNFTDGRVTFKVIIDPANGVPASRNDFTGTLVYSQLGNRVTTNYANQEIDLTGYTFGANNTIKLVYHVTTSSAVDYSLHTFYVDNIRATSSPQGTATSTPITLASVQNVEKYKDLVWTQTLNGGTVNLKIQQYNGSTWADVAGYTNISATGDGLKSFDLTAMTAYSQIRLVAALSGSATVAVNDWSVTFENPCDAIITGVTNASGCATAILEATASATTTQYLWYDAASAGNLLGTTTTGSWTTPVLTATTTTFYVAASNGTCESPRVAVVASLTPTNAAILSTQGAAICTTESVTLYAETADDNLYTVNWYDAATGGQLVHTGYSYTLTPTSSATYYVAAAEGTCESTREAVEIALASKIWNGSADTVWNNAANWTPNGTPSLTNCVVIPVTANAPVIDANYNALAKSLTLEANAVLLVKTGSSIKVVNEVTVGNDADFTLENDAYLVQTQNVASNLNTGTITVNRHSTPMYRLEATGWSSPVENQNIYGFALGTVAGRVYEYDEPANAFSSTNVTANSTFVPGKGYSVRSPNTYPNFTDIPAQSPIVFEGIFKGKPQNGDIGINITATNRGYNYVGNPYPSPIDAAAFLGSNQNIESLYFWTHEAPPINGVYAANNYAAYSNAGGTQAAAGGASPDGIIQVGQGFIVKTIQGYVLEFTNDMRLTSSNGQFFKNQTEERHRMWLNLSDETTPYNQILIGYVPNATMAADHQIDAKLFGYSGSSIYTLIDETKYVIEGRSLPFQSTDIVPLGFKAATTGMYNISINNVDGIFSEGQTIYLKDKEATVTHNLTESNYVFSSQAGTFNDRFEIVYTSEVLGIDQNAAQANNWFAYKNDNSITIKSRGFEIESVEIFDLTGRLLLSKDKVNATEFKCPANFADQMLLVKINKTLSKKVL